MITQEQVAREVGLDRTTVGAILNGKATLRVRPETRVRVLAAAKRLGYRPNQLARGLRLNKTNTIALAIRTMKHPHQAYINEQIVELLEARQFEVLITAARELQQTDRIEDLVLSHRPAGLIVGPLYAQSGHPVYQRLVRRRLPLVGYHGGGDFPGDHVLHDMYRVVEMGLAHLKELGHERIDHVTAAGGVRPDWFAEQTNGGQTHAYFGTIQNGYEFAQQIPVGANAPTAYWLEDPLFALGFLRGLRLREVRVPEDVAFVTVSMGDLGRSLETSFTTVYPDLDELAQRVVSLLWQRIGGELPPERQEIFLEPRLTVGETTVKRRRHSEEPTTISQ